MARAGACAGGPGANEILGKLMPDSAAVGEFGPPLFLHDNSPADVTPALLTRPPDGSATIHEIITNTVKRYPNRNSVGTRRLVKVHQVQEGAKTFEKLELANEVEWMTYTQYGKRITDFASGLMGLAGLPPKERVVIYAETQRDWMLAALSSFSMSLEVVTIYATLGEEGALFGLNQTKAQVCVADGKLLKVLSKIAGQCPALRHVITMGEIDAKLADKLKEAGKTVTDIDEVVQKGGQAPVDPRPPAPEDVAVLMYTSGTTGTPKGVLLTHANITSACAGFHLAGSSYGVSEETVFLAYLPLAHIMEMVAEISILLFGAALGYGSPHTLTTSSGVKLKRPESEGDAIVFKPTFMVFAPAVFDKVYKGVSSQVAAKGNMVKKIFNYALECGMTNFENGRMGVNPILNRIAFSAPQQALGGRVKLAITGSAPLSPEIQKFMQTVLKAPVRQGYGLTENCACATVGTPPDNMVKSVGAPQACTVIRLADWPEGLYMNSDKTRPDVGMSRGEVLVGGPTVCIGYYVDPANPDPEIVKKNEEDFVTIEGMRYFRTGDIGQITPIGTLQIIDRKKDLWKGPQGEYVALSKVESAMKLSPYVDIPMVYGKTGGDYPVALLTIVDKEVAKWATANGCPTSGPDMCKNAKVVEEVFKSVKEKAKEVGLVAFEIPQKICLLGNVDGQPPWTPENDMLTAAMKLKRPVIARAHAADIDAMY